MDVLAASFPATGLRIFDPAGTQLADIPLGRDHPCPQTITRAALSAILREQARDHGILVQHGKRLVSAVTSPAGQVTVNFADGTQATGDLLIGADGIHSAVRTLIGFICCHCRPRCAAWRGRGARSCRSRGRGLVRAGRPRAGGRIAIARSGPGVL